MQGSAWVALLRRIPPAMHDNLVIVTSTNTEIVVQNLVRLERDFVVIRGRMSGSQDTGRIVIVPYDQINFAGFVKPIDDVSLQAMLGKRGAAGKAEPVAEAAVPKSDPQGTAADDEVVDFLAAAIEEAAAAAAQEPPAEEDETAGSAAAGNKPNHPSKTVLLARLRSRLAADNVKPAKP